MLEYFLLYYTSLFLNRKNHLIYSFAFSRPSKPITTTVVKSSASIMADECTGYNWVLVKLIIQTDSMINATYGFCFNIDRKAQKLARPV